MKRMLFILLASAVALCAAGPFRAAAEDAEYPFQDPDLPREERVADLVERPALEEKISLMNERAETVSASEKYTMAQGDKKQPGKQPGKQQGKGRGRAGGMGVDMGSISRYLKYLPPRIGQIRQSPRNPGPDDTVTISARISRIRFGRDDNEYIKTVTLFYSMDRGESWEEFDMDQDGDDGKLWVGEIPAADECGRVRYYIHAEDSMGNLALEIPPYLAMPGWEPPSGDEESEDTPHDYLPLMFEHEDAQNFEIPAHLDVLTMWFGYDEDHLYFRTEFQAPVNGGSITPLDANAYILILFNGALNFNPGMISQAMRGQGGDKTEKMAKKLWGWFYAPMGEAAPPVNGIKIPGEGLVHIEPPDWKAPIFEKQGYEYDIWENYLDLTIDRSMIGQSENNTITFAMANARVTGADITKAQFEQGDISYSVTASMYGHAYSVCGEN